MKEWLEHGYWDTIERVKNDTVYQALLAECTKQEKAYERIMLKLTPEERTVVEDDIALCEELQYQKTHTAYYCGMDAGAKGK